ncbi:DUF3108 domain-containing protein [Sediminibacterium sp. TEGAF015]|uniref:DUF3108 domain-containing protein n=1 Tax=Sediminibacterium sp. TEGAF015 TaxID=575378 RepID=UPI0021FB307C|nr:DUF3108 domain-containing protein [Sediminibacterium sp. TEGAF015]BDQ12279.1 hypothetical protein TEGAF0_14960 [Sediminibacterium sp. TEGAF015]
MLKKSLIVFISLLLTRPLTAGDEFCGIRNYAFQSGEQISFTVFYNVIGLYVNAGAATFSVNSEKLNNESVYHLVGEGSSNSRYDWIFKVRDKYESYIDTSNLQPIRFIRNVNEGGYKINENVSFNRQNNTATSEKGTVKVPNCIQDVLSAIYYARNINFEKYKPEDKIPFTMFLDNEIFNLYIKYLGKETIKTRFGKFRAIKFKPLLVKGTLFEGGEKMTVWVSDDANHIPLRIESPIVVGSVKVDMMGYKNLRYPFSSMISER